MDCRFGISQSSCIHIKIAPLSMRGNAQMGNRGREQLVIIQKILIRLEVSLHISGKSGLLY